MKRPLLLVFIIAQAIISFGQHTAGSEITYRPLYSDSTVFEITFRVYRDYGDTNFTDIDSSAYIRCKNSSTSTMLTPVYTSARNISALCDSPTQSVTYLTRTTYGFEERTYKDTIDFSNSAFQSYYQCQETYIELRQATRRTTTNLDSGAYYNRAVMYPLTFPNNASSRADINPIVVIASGYGTRHYHKQFDEDGDSLSFAMVPALYSDTVSAQYSSGYFSAYPFSVFFQTGNTHPYSDPTGRTPEGFYFDSKRGDMIFTPTKNETITYVVEVTEWRRDTSGAMQKAGLTRRDVTCKVYTPEDFLPFFTSIPNSWAGCIGENNTITVKAEDFPSTVSGNTVYDTLAFHVESDYPLSVQLNGATYSGRTAAEASISFNTDSFQSIPRSFEALIYTSPRDKCFGYNQDVRRLKVEIYEQPDLDLQINHLGCGNIEVTASIDTFEELTSVVSYLVHDASQQLIRFGFLSAQQKTDTFVVREPGELFITAMSSYSLYCDSTLIDTIELLATDVYQLPRDTNVLACGLDSVLIPIPSVWDVIWDNGDTTHARYVHSSGNYMAQLIDDCDDTVSISFQVNFRNYTPVLSDTTICENGTARYEVDLPAHTAVIWPDQNSSNAYETSDTGTFTMAVYDSLCMSIQSYNFHVGYRYAPVVSTDPSYIVCKDSMIVVMATTDIQASFLWSSGSTTDTAHIRRSGTYTVRASNACGSTYDTFSVSQKNPPAIDLGNDVIICRTDSATIGVSANPEHQYLWSTGATESFINVKTEAEYMLTASNNCGSTIDTVYLYVLDTPSVDLGPDTAKNEFDIINIKNLTPSRFATYKWNIGSNANNIDVRLEGTYWLIETNICGSDTDSIVVRYRLGIPSGPEMGFEAYPNPVSKQLTILNRSGKPGTLDLFDQHGKLVSSHMLAGPKYLLNVEELRSGMYFIRISSDERSTTMKLIVNHVSP